MSMAGEQQLEVYIAGATPATVTPCAKRGIASRAMLVGTEVMSAKLEVVVDPAIGGEETLRMMR
jgi:hypothetical protein